MRIAWASATCSPCRSSRLLFFPCPTRKASWVLGLAINVSIQKMLNVCISYVYIMMFPVGNLQPVSVTFDFNIRKKATMPVVAAYGLFMKLLCLQQALTAHWSRNIVLRCATFFRFDQSRCSAPDSPNTAYIQKVPRGWMKNMEQQQPMGSCLKYAHGSVAQFSLQPRALIAFGTSNLC